MANDKPMGDGCWHSSIRTHDLLAAYDEDYVLLALPSRRICNAWRAVRGHNICPDPIEGSVGLAAGQLAIALAWPAVLRNVCVSPYTDDRSGWSNRRLADDAPDFFLNNTYSCGGKFVLYIF